MKKMGEKKEIIGLAAILSIVMFCTYAKMANYNLADHNLNVLFYSYRDGFVAAGFIGTVWRVLNAVLPIELMAYKPVYYTAKWMMVLYNILVIILLLITYQKSKANKRIMIPFIVLATVISGGMFRSATTMGSFDMYEMIILLITMIVLFVEKAVWLSVPLVVIGMLIHPSFLFKGIPIIIAILWYRSCRDIQKRSYYIAIRNVICIVSLVIFTLSEWCAIVSPGKEEEFIALGRLLSQNGNSYDIGLATYAMRECSSIMPEWGYHQDNYVALLVFFLCFSPYLLIGRNYYVHLYQRSSQNGIPHKLYRMMQLGGLALLPEFIFKVNYGYFISEICLYYILIFIFYIVAEDKYIIEEIYHMDERIKERIPIPEILLIYPLAFMPFMDVSISNVIHSLTRIFGAW